MKNLLLGIVVLIALAAAQKPSVEDHVYDHFPAQTFPDGFPLSTSSDIRCARDAPIFMLRPGKESRNITAREGPSFTSYIDMGRTGRIGGDFTVTFAFRLLQEPEAGMVLFHAGNEYNSMIELRIGGRPCMGPRCGDIEPTSSPTGSPTFIPTETVTPLLISDAQQKQVQQQKGARGERPGPTDDQLRFRVSPDYFHGGDDKISVIQAAEVDRIYAGDWVHVVAVHEHKCNKLDSGLTLYINGEKSFDYSRIGRDRYDWAFLPPMNGNPIRREYQYLGRSSMRRSVPMSADFTCLQILDRAATLGEVETLYKSANQYLKREELYFSEY